MHARVSTRPAEFVFAKEGIMRINLSLLTKDEVNIWNARWSAGSRNSTKELLNDLQFCVREKMESNLEISTHQLGHWLVKNGWTPTRGSGTERQWKKKPAEYRDE